MNILFNIVVIIIIISLSNIIIIITKYCNNIYFLTL